MLQEMRNRLSENEITVCIVKDCDTRLNNHLRIGKNSIEKLSLHAFIIE